GDQEAIELAKILESHYASNVLNDLYLGNNQIGDAGTIALAKALEKSMDSKLKSFNAKNGNQMGNKRITKREAYTNRLSLVLHLQNNQIGDAGAAALAKLLRSYPLFHLDLSGNQIGDEGAIKLAKALEIQHIFLGDLILERNKIGDAG